MTASTVPSEVIVFIFRANEYNKLVSEKSGNDMPSTSLAMTCLVQGISNMPRIVLNLYVSQFQNIHDKFHQLICQGT